MKLEELTMGFTAQQRKLAGKFPIREAEEMEKGHWVAFADDGGESYDVHITLAKGEVTMHSCDCGKYDRNGYCLHQLGLMIWLGEKDPGKVKRVKVAPKAKKGEEWMKLLESTDHCELKTWLAEVFRAQKDLALAFQQKFGETPETFTIEDIRRINMEAIKSVVKNRKNIDASELGKIIALWKTGHEKIVQYCLKNLADPTAYQLFEQLVEEIALCYNPRAMTWKKVNVYLKQLVSQLVKPMFGLVNDELWERLINNILKMAFSRKANSWLLWMGLVEEIAELETRENKVSFILDGFRKQMQEISGHYMENAIAKRVWNLYQKLGRTAECLPWINQLSFDRDFNLALVDACLEHGLTEKAENICQTFIKTSINKQYELHFLIRLKYIYASEPKKRRELHQVLLALLHELPEFEDYLILEKEYFGTNQAALKKWQTNLLKRLGDMMEGSYEMGDVFCQICIHHKLAEKAFQTISTSHSFVFALQYFNEFYALDRVGFLKTMLSIHTSYYNMDENEDVVPDLGERVLQHYTIPEIRAAMKEQLGWGHSDLNAYLKECMRMGKAPKGQG